MCIHKPSRTRDWRRVMAALFRVIAGLQIVGICGAAAAFQLNSSAPRPGLKKIKHIVFIVKENRVTARGSAGGYGGIGTRAAGIQFALQTLKVGADFGGDLVAQVLLLFQQLIEDAFELSGHVAVELYGRDRARYEGCCRRSRRWWNRGMELARRLPPDRGPSPGRRDRCGSRVSRLGPALGTCTRSCLRWCRGRGGEGRASCEGAMVSPSREPSGSRSFAKPKSRILAVPRSVMNRFAGLMSR